MKKTILIIAVLFSLGTFAQKNVIKVNIVSPAYRDFSLSFERGITPKSSINLTIGMINLDPILFKYGSELYEEGWAEAAPWLNKLESGKHASLEYRFYLSQNEAPRGLYVAPYARYWQFGFDLDDYINDNTNSTKDFFDIKGEFYGISGGIQLGYQWIIAKRFSVDWYFLGGGVQNLTAKGTYKIVPDQAGFDYSTIVEDVTDGWDKIPKIQKHLSIDPQESQLKLSTYTMLPDFRAGFKIGFAF